jgi:hypothetical protein
LHVGVDIETALTAVETGGGKGLSRGQYPNYPNALVADPDGYVIDPDGNKFLQQAECGRGEPGRAHAGRPAKDLPDLGKR